jgi:hypothetical protein
MQRAAERAYISVERYSCTQRERECVVREMRADVSQGTGPASQSAAALELTTASISKSHSFFQLGTLLRLRLLFSSMISTLLAFTRPSKKKLYKPLDWTRSQIRLLVLPAGASSDPIHCSLRSVSINDRRPYTAVSYAWGTNQTKRQIDINGIQVYINENVFDLLTTVRDVHDQQFLWIDAICINQEDAKEKAQQVMIMGTIYRNARSTYIWLGTSTEDSDLAMDLVVHAGPGKFEQPKLIIKEREWKALYKLMRRSWWCRMWIVQEACLSQNPIVRCGNKVVPLKRFQNFYQLHQKFNGLPDRVLPLHIRVLFSDVPFAYVLSSWDTLVQKSLRGELSLITWLIRTGYNQCTLPRDRLFASLSIASSEDRKAIKVDYERPDREVFKEAAIHLMRSKGSELYRLGE